MLVVEPKGLRDLGGRRCMVNDSSQNVFRHSAVLRHQRHASPAEVMHCPIGNIFFDAIRVPVLQRPAVDRFFQI